MVANDTAAMMLARSVALLPSPFDPMGFSKYGLSGVWFLVTGMLIVKDCGFPRLPGILGIVSGLGLVVLFGTIVSGAEVAMNGLGMLGAFVVGPLFWLQTSWVLIQPASKS